MLFINMSPMEQYKDEILPGTLNPMVLKTLSILGSLHRYGIARRIEQITGEHPKL
jgi:PadR family transcriptional regulator, regulatory protein PadR